MSELLNFQRSLEVTGQIINLCAAILLLLSFAMLAQRRILTLINLFMLQGFVLFISTLIVALTTGQNHLFWSAGLTLLLKVFALPWILHRLIRRLSIKWDIETLFNIPTTMLIGILLVIISFNVAQPISQLSGTIMRSTVGIALAVKQANRAVERDIALKQPLRLPQDRCYAKTDLAVLGAKTKPVLPAPPKYR